MVLEKLHKNMSTICSLPQVGITYLSSIFTITTHLALRKVAITWKQVIIISILKSGNSRQCKSYQNIILLPITERFFMGIFLLHF